MKPKARVRGLSLVTVKPQGVDLGVLQTELLDANKNVKASAKRLADAELASDEAKAKQRSAVERLAAASKAVLNS